VRSFETFVTPLFYRWQRVSLLRFNHPNWEKRRPIQNRENSSTQTRGRGADCNRGGNSRAETFDLSEVMRGATAGKVVWNTDFKLWQGSRRTCCTRWSLKSGRGRPLAGAPEPGGVHRQRV